MGSAGDDGRRLCPTNCCNGCGQAAPLNLNVKHKMNRLAINTVGDELGASATFCRSQEIGIEVTDFAFPKHFEDDIAMRIDRHVKTVSGIFPIISHGPYADLIAHSNDKLIVEVCRERHSKSIDAARQIGAKVYVAHTNYNPMIRNLSYRKNYAKRMREFWLPFADQVAKHGITICLENLWEPTPEIQAELVSAANHPNLKASFDNGHALVFSEKPASDWIEMLGFGLAHCHLHDNSGELDEHKPVGEGKENWQELLSAVRNCSPTAILVAESDRLDRNRKSFEKLKSF